MAVPAPRLRSSSLGIVYMILSCCAFSAMWVLIRYASDTIHSFEIVFFRNAFGLVVLMPMVLANPGLIQWKRWKLHAARGTSGFIAMICIFYAVANAPMAIAISINYTAPLFATLAAVLFLRERLRARRIISLAVGFIGMLIVVRPGQMPLTPGIVSALVAALAMAFSIIAIRRLVSSDDSRAVAVWSFLFGLIPSLLVALWVWRWPSPVVWLLLFGVGASAAVGQLLLTRAFSVAEASMVLPFDFVRFVLITLAGIVLFSERYDIFTLLGGALILLSTIYLGLREAQLSRQARAAGLLQAPDQERPRLASGD